ncbi:MAG: DNA mismatch repair protein MutT [Chloroflexi bacterium]|nr:MAG: DNA mismatch repair protein MutT [Chloroflexota bacterium]
MQACRALSRARCRWPDGAWPLDRDEGQRRVSSRKAVRVLLFDEADRVLLVRFWDGDRSWWCTPGGGIEPGETDEATALREIREELGSESVELGARIWTRRHIGVFRGRPFDQRERIYLGRVAAFEPRPTPMALCEHGLDDFRWWTLDELAGGADEFAPRRLATLARDIVRAGPPKRPIDVGV